MSASAIIESQTEYVKSTLDNDVTRFSADRANALHTNIMVLRAQFVVKVLLIGYIIGCGIVAWVLFYSKTLSRNAAIAIIAAIIAHVIFMLYKV